MALLGATVVVAAGTAALLLPHSPSALADTLGGGGPAAVALVVAAWAALTPLMVDRMCLVHVHSTFSDGTATPGEIVAAARVAGADGCPTTLSAPRFVWATETPSAICSMTPSPR